MRAVLNEIKISLSGREQPLAELGALPFEGTRGSIVPGETGLGSLLLGNEPRIYTRKAAQKKLAVSAAAKMASGAAKERAGVPLTVPPSKKLMQNSILSKKWLPGPDSNQRPSG